MTDFQITFFAVCSYTLITFLEVPLVIDYILRITVQELMNHESRNPVGRLVSELITASVRVYYCQLVCTSLRCPET
jgi:hypothetical protein